MNHHEEDQKQPLEPLSKEEAGRRLADMRKRLPSRIRASMKKAMKVRRYELYECLITNDWDDPNTLTIVIVSRKMPDKKLAMALFLVDLACLGIKEADLETSVSRDRYAELKSRMLGEHEENLQPCTPELAARVIDHGVRYALAMGFPPHRDYFPAINLLAGHDPNATDEAVPLGDDGVPTYWVGPHDDVDAIMKKLTEELGPGGFHYVMPLG